MDVIIIIRSEAILFRSDPRASGPDRMFVYLSVYCRLRSLEGFSSVLAGVPYSQLPKGELVESELYGALCESLDSALNDVCDNLGNPLSEVSLKGFKMGTPIYSFREDQPAEMLA